MGKQPITSYTRPLETKQGKKLRKLLRERGYAFHEVPYALWAAKGTKVNIVFYESGKLVVQGKETEDFVSYILEPEILKRAEMGYETVHHPEMNVPRIGVDESGKGDLFGPLCIAGVYVNAEMVKPWKEAGIRDSKRVRNDRQVGELADVIRRTRGCVYDVVVIGNAAYNRLYAQLASVNRMLAWGHARVIENLQGQRHRMQPPPERAILDQFSASQSTVADVLMRDGRQLEVIQRHKAESDLSVAAASILARDEFVRRLGRLGEAEGVELPKGAGDLANQALADWVKRHGPERLKEIAKCHFRNMRIINELSP
jgi:ribonuclease HIII